MSKQSGLWYVGGMFLTSIGVGYTYGIGNGLIAIGLFMVFASVFAEWE